MFRNKWFWVAVIVVLSAAYPVTMSTAFHNLGVVFGGLVSTVASILHGVFHNLH